MSSSNDKGKGPAANTRSQAQSSQENLGKPAAGAPVKDEASLASQLADLQSRFAKLETTARQERAGRLKAEAEKTKAEAEKAQAEADLERGRDLAGEEIQKQTDIANVALAAAKSLDINIDKRLFDLDLKINKPNIWDGNPELLKVFFHTCEQTFKFRAKTFETDAVKVAYAASFLTGNPAKWHMALDENEDKIRENWEDWKQALRQTYLIVDATTSAKAKLRHFKQTGSVLKYVEAFENLCLEASIEDEDAKEIFFMNGLKDNIKDLIYASPLEYEGFKAIKEVALRLDAKAKIRQLEKGKQPAGERPSRGQSNNNNNNRSGNPGNNNSGNSSKRRGPLTQKEKDVRKANGECLYCGKKGHSVDKCRAKPQRSSANATTTTQTRPRQQTLGAAPSGNEQGQSNALVKYI